MKSRWSCSLWLLAGLLVVVGLPIAGKWSRRHQAQRCDLDGLAIEPLYRVRVLDSAGGSRQFCCVGCASRWLARQETLPAKVWVTDEIGGTEVEAESAQFVHSTVLTNAVTRNRIHVFQDAQAAKEHARAFDGWILSEADRPIPRMREGN